MIVEMRSYILHPGHLGTFMQRMESEGIGIEQPILGRLLGFYSTDIGPLNKVIHLWGYDSHADRDKRRAELAKDPRWQAFVPTVLPLIQQMQNELLLPAAFSPQ